MSVTPEDIVSAREILDEIAADPNPFSNLAISIEDIKYGGRKMTNFDPDLLLRILRRRAHANQKTDADFKKDMMSLAVLGTMRGFDLNKLMMTSTEITKNFIREMVTVYRINSGRPASNEDPTIARIAVCLVRPISEGLFTGRLNVKTTVDPNTICADFPRCMCWPSFGFLIPASRPGGLINDDCDLLLNAFRYHQKKFFGIMNYPNNSSFDILRNVENQFESQIYKTEIREKHCVAVGLLESVDNRLTIKAAVRDPLKVAATQWCSELQMADDLR